MSDYIEKLSRAVDRHVDWYNFSEAYHSLALYSLGKWPLQLWHKSVGNNIRSKEREALALALVL